MCMDYRVLNDVTIRDEYPSKNMDDLIDRAAGYNYYSILDMKSSYWQLEVDKESRHRTAFALPNGGLYEWRMMPFGLKKTPWLRSKGL